MRGSDMLSDLVEVIRDFLAGRTGGLKILLGIGDVKK